MIVAALSKKKLKSYMEIPPSENREFSGTWRWMIKNFLIGARLLYRVDFTALHLDKIQFAWRVIINLVVGQLSIDSLFLTRTFLSLPLEAPSRHLRHNSVWWQLAVGCNPKTKTSKLSDKRLLTFSASIWYLSSRFVRADNNVADDDLIVRKMVWGYDGGGIRERMAFLE